MKTPVDHAAWPKLLIRFGPDDLNRLRSATAAHVAEMGAGDRVEDVVLLVHELATNAIKHGGGSGQLRLWRDGCRLMCQVSDSGPGLADADRAGTMLPSVMTPGGRGLWIARCLATVRIETGPSGTAVTAAVAL